jgi:hypothetical protein
MKLSMFRKCLSELVFRKFINKGLKNICCYFQIFLIRYTYESHSILLILNVKYNYSKMNCYVIQNQPYAFLIFSYLLLLFIEKLENNYHIIVFYKVWLNIYYNKLYQLNI